MPSCASDPSSRPENPGRSQVQIGVGVSKLAIHCDLDLNLRPQEPRLPKTLFRVVAHPDTAKPSVQPPKTHPQLVNTTSSRVAEKEGWRASADNT